MTSKGGGALVNHQSTPLSMLEEVADGRRLSEGVNMCAPARREVNGSYWIERARLTSSAQRCEGEDGRLEPQQVERSMTQELQFLGVQQQQGLAAIQCSKILSLPPTLLLLLSSSRPSRLEDSGA